jgi:hypothetical protein
MQLSFAPTQSIGGKRWADNARDEVPNIALGVYELSDVDEF